MIPETIVSMGHKALRVLKVFGRFDFVRRLYDFLAHEGRRSRAETLERTAKVVTELEKAEALRIRNSKAIVELMKAAKFSDEQIQVALGNPTELNRVSVALAKMLLYVDNGSVAVQIVSTDESSPRPNLSAKVRSKKQTLGSLDSTRERRRLLAKKSAKK